MSSTRRIRVLRWSEGDEPVECGDELATEEPLEIRSGGTSISVTMRTPGNDIELVAGFLFSEGLIPADQTPLLRQEAPNVVNAVLPGDVDLTTTRRGTLTSSSCGLCGKGEMAAIHRHFPPLPDDSLRFPANRLHRLLESLQEAQTGFARTGGAHAAALFDEHGELIVAREDVGRHNAVDKAIGFALIRRLLPLSRALLLVSSRGSFEILQKSLAARVPIVAVVSAPSSLAAEFAEANGQTLIGFLRPGRCNVYSHAERIVFPPSVSAD